MSTLGSLDDDSTAVLTDEIYQMVSEWFETNLSELQAALHARFGSSFTPLYRDILLHVLYNYCRNLQDPRPNLPTPSLTPVSNAHPTPQHISTPSGSVSGQGVLGQAHRGPYGPLAFSPAGGSGGPQYIGTQKGVPFVTSFKAFCAVNALWAKEAANDEKQTTQGGISAKALLSVWGFGAEFNMYTMRTPPPWFVWRDCGQLGRLGAQDEPLQVQLQVDYGETRILGVSVGWNHTILHTVDAVFSCGNNLYGQLGLVDNSNRVTPTRIDELLGKIPIAVAAGREFSIIAVNDVATDELGQFVSITELYACGNNAYGQLGKGDHNHRNYPSRLPPVGGLEAVQHLACGEFHSIAAGSFGVLTWGSNSFGQLGRSDRQHSLLPTPVPVMEGKRILAVRAGAKFSLFWTPEGIYSCGLNTMGQLAHSVYADSRGTPTLIRTLIGEKIFDIACGQEFFACHTQSGLLLYGGAHGRKCVRVAAQAGSEDDEALTPLRVPAFGPEVQIGNIACSANHLLVESTTKVTICNSQGEVLADVGLQGPWRGKPFSGPAASHFALFSHHNARTLGVPQRVPHVKIVGPAPVAIAPQGVAGAGGPKQN